MNLCAFQLSAGHRNLRQSSRAFQPAVFQADELNNRRYFLRLRQDCQCLCLIRILRLVIRVFFCRTVFSDRFLIIVVRRILPASVSVFRIISGRVCVRNLFPAPFFFLPGGFQQFSAAVPTFRILSAPSGRAFRNFYGTFSDPEVF